MPQLKVTLAENLKRFLTERKMTQKELAEKIGVSIQTVSVIANAKSGLTPETLAKIASVLNVEETDLVAVHKPAEKVELRKDQWEILLKQMNSISSHKISMPSDILRDFEALDPKLHDAAIVAIRAVVAGLKGKRPKGNSGSESNTG